MLRALPLGAVPRYPVTAGAAALAVVATLLWWTNHDLSWALMDGRWWPREPWRPATSVLPHADVLHLVFNLYWLWVFGAVIEERFGHLRAAGVVVLLALGSSLAQWALSGPGVGLSGVGYGLFGLLWMLSRKDYRFAGMIDGGTIQLFLFWFVLCVILTVTKYMPVGNVAHASGAIVGALLGLSLAGRAGRRRLALAALVALMLLIGVLATIGRPYVNVL